MHRVKVRISRRRCGPTLTRCALPACGSREGDLRCLLAGHLARLAVNTLRGAWDAAAPTAARFERAKLAIEALVQRLDSAAVLAALLPKGNGRGLVRRAKGRERLPHPFEVDLAYLNSHVDELIDVTFADIQSQFSCPKVRTSSSWGTSRTCTKP